MRIVDREDLKNIDVFTKSRIDWPELESMVKKLGNKDMGRGCLRRKSVGSLLANSGRVLLGIRSRTSVISMGRSSK